MTSWYDRFQASELVKELETVDAECLFHWQYKTDECTISVWGVPINVTKTIVNPGHAISFDTFSVLATDLYALISSRWREEKPGQEVQRPVHMTMGEPGTYHLSIVEHLEKALSDRLAREMPDLCQRVDTERGTWTIQRKNT
jgi:hypothetical protein